MRLSVFTNTKIFTLEGGAKDIFMHLVLTPDENNQVMPVQHFDAKMLQRAKNLALDNGIDATIKNKIIEAFEELREGDRFLMNKAFVTDIKGGEVAYYWRIVALLNDGSNRTPNEAQAVAQIGEREFNIKLKDAQ